LKIKDIIINKRLRKLNNEKVNQLAESIKEIGLLNPITVKGNVLVAGLHRLEAVKKLNWEEIPTRQLEKDDELRTELAEIDENLVKADLTWQEEVKHLKRRKEIYEALYPETKKGIAGAIAKWNSGIMPNATDKMSFAENTAHQIGKSERTIQRDIEIAEAIEEYPELENLKTKTDVLREIRKKKRFEESKKLAQEFDLTEHNNKIILYNNDFRKVDIKENSVDLILTDPPYPKEFLGLWKDLFLYAEKVLKPSGFLVSYSGQLHLPDIFKFEHTLLYYWIFALYHKGNTQIINGRSVMCRWKPILIFQKRPFKKLNFVPEDLVYSKKSEKTEHNWQQSESGCKELIEIFSKPNDLILDPFMGSGTTIVTAIQNKRKAIGIEINNQTYNIAKARLYNIKN